MLEKIKKLLNRYPYSVKRSFLVFTLAGLIGDLLIFNPEIYNLTIGGVHFHIIPSLVLAVAAGIFIPTLPLLLMSLIFALAMTLKVDISVTYFLLCFFFYFIPSSMAYASTKSFQLHIEKIKLLSVAMLFVISVVSSMTSVLSGIFMSEFGFPTGLFETTVAIGILQGILAWVILIFLLGTHKSLRLVSEGRARVEIVSWWLAPILMITIILCFVAIIVGNQQLFGSFKEQYLVNEYRQLDTEARILEKSYLEKEQYIKNDLKQLAILPEAQHHYLDRFQKRVEEVFTRRNIYGLDSLSVLSEDMERKIQVGTDYSNFKDYKEFLNLVAKKYTPSRLQTKEIPTVFGSINFLSEEPYAIYAVPIYEISPDPNKAYKSPSLERKGFVVGIVDLKIMFSRILDFYTEGGLVNLAYISNKDKSINTIVCPMIERSVGSEYLKKLENSLKNKLKKAEMTEVKFIEYLPGEASFNKSSKVSYLYAVSELKKGDYHIGFGSIFPKEFIEKNLTTTQKESNSYTILFAVLLTSLVILILAGVITANRNLTVLLKAREKKVKSLVEKQYRGLKHMMDALPLGVLVADKLGNIKLHNPRARIFLGWDDNKNHKHLRKTPFWDVIERCYKENRIIREEKKFNDRIYGISAVKENIMGEKLAVVTLSDITETRKIQESLIIDSKLRVLGELAGGFTHEIGNPLAIALGNIELLVEDEEITEDKKEIAETAYEALMRASKIIKNIVLFSHGSSGTHSSKIDLNELVGRTVGLLKSSFEETDIEIKLNLSNEELVVEANPSSIEQVIVSLLLNAVDAVKEKPTDKKIFIRTKNLEKKALIEIEDKGPGIPYEISDSIFDPFFTTKGNQDSTGLGLFVAYNLVKQDNGNIDFSSKEGEGTIFKVTYSKLDQQPR